MSESVKILIEAENKATPVIESTAKLIDDRVKLIKTSGENAKKSTEFFGVIATTLGGSELGSYAGQLANITDKTSQFAEVQKLGGAGALAFKAGIVGVVGVLAYQVGSAIGNVIFQTQKWTDSLAKALEKSKELASVAAKNQATRFSDRKEDIEIFQNPAAKKEAYTQLLQQIKTELKSVESQTRGSQKAAEDWNAAWQITGNRKGYAEQANAKLAEDKERLKALQDERAEIEKMLSPRTEENRLIAERQALVAQADDNVKKLKEEIGLLEGKVKFYSVEEEQLTKKRDLIKSTQEKTKTSDEFINQLKSEVELLKAKGDEVFALEAKQKTNGAFAQNEAVTLLKEKQALTDKQEAEKQATEQKENEIKRVNDLRQTELERLEQVRVLLEKGKEAAHAFNLEKQGLSKTEAANIARQQAELDKIKAKPEANKQQATPELKATESRLLTRGGSSEDPTKMVAVNTAKMIDELQQMNKRMTDQATRGTTLRVIKK